MKSYGVVIVSLCFLVRKPIQAESFFEIKLAELFFPY
jgi:hypothetical protein